MTILKIKEMNRHLLKNGKYNFVPCLNFRSYLGIKNECT